MPSPLTKGFIALSLSALIFSFFASPLPAKEFQGIKTYYIRLDHQFKANKSTNARVTMVPAENEFRAENFSLVLVEGTIRADRQTSETTIAAMAQKEAFARVLQAHGLKSVQTLNQDMTVSYEGVIISPLDITISTFDPLQDGYPYTAGVKFSSLAFPDQWDSMKNQYTIKQILNDFFLLFK